LIPKATEIIKLAIRLQKNQVHFILTKCVIIAKVEQAIFFIVLYLVNFSGPSFQDQNYQCLWLGLVLKINNIKIGLTEDIADIVLGVFRL
jgi:hypothetical protein